MGRLRRTAGAGLLALACAVAGCGGRAAPKLPSDPTEAAAAASVARLAAAVRKDDPKAACRSLTLATRRVVGLIGTQSRGCTDGLAQVLATYGLQRPLRDARDLGASVRGARAAVQGPGFREPLTTVRNGGGWRVSFLGIPGVRGDVAAARACGSWSRAADARTLPPFEPGALAARLRSDAALLERLRRRLRAVPPEGPTRLGLADVARSIGQARMRLQSQARRVEGGGDVQKAMDATARADRLVRSVLSAQGPQARIACPRAATVATTSARHATLERTCLGYAAILDRLSRDPGGLVAARALLVRVRGALTLLDGQLGRVPVTPTLAHLRREAHVSIAGMRTAVGELGTSDDTAALRDAGRRVEGYGAQVAATFVRLGAGCLTVRSTAPAPRVTPRTTPLPTPRTAPLPTPAPRPRATPRRRLPPGTVVS